MSYHVDRIPNRSSPPAILLRHAYREGSRIRKQTLANLSKLPPHMVTAIEQVVRGGVVFDSPDAAFSIQRSLPHGHVVAVLGMCRQLQLPRLLHRSASRERDLALAGIVARLLAPQSKLATARWLSADTAGSSLGAMLELGNVTGNELLRMLDWLLSRQAWIERSLAKRHLHQATLVLYDVTSSYVEGRCCSLAQFGYNRDGKRGKRQIVIGLLCAQDGCPIAVEVFQGNTADPSTVARQVDKLRQRFGVTEIALVGDRGMVTSARIRETLKPLSLDWISALRSTDLKTLMKVPEDAAVAPLQPDQLEADTIAEINSPDYPGERLLVCLNPRLRTQRAQEREALLQATEALLQDIADAVQRKRSRLKTTAAIERRIGRDVNRYKMSKHFQVTVKNRRVTFERRLDSIQSEAQLDGIYVIRTNLSSESIDAEEAVAAYKSLANVERAFRTLKTTCLALRPLYVYSDDHVRAHVFLCMLAYYVEWHLRRQLKPMLFDDDDPDGASRDPDTPVAPAQRSPSAQHKLRTRTTPQGLPLHSLSTLLADLGTLCVNQTVLASNPDQPFLIATQPTPHQRQVFEQLNLDPGKMFPVRVQS